MKKLPVLMIMVLALLLALPTVGLADDAGAYVDLSSQGLVASVQVSSVNLRSGPGTRHDVVGSANYNTRLPILGAMQSVEMWYEVRTDSGQRAWVASWLVRTIQSQASSMMAPADSTLFISLDTSPGFFDRLDDLLAVTNNFSVTATSVEFDRMISALFSNPLVGAEEVRPWLGDEVAVTHLRCISSTMSTYLMSDTLVETPPPNVIIMAEVRNNQLARQFITRATTTGPLANAPKQELTYQGISYTLLNDPASASYATDAPTIALGIIGDYMVFAQGTAPFEEVVNTAIGARPSLGSNDGFRDVYGNLLVTSFMRVYVGPQLFCPTHEPILFNALYSDIYRDGNAAVPGVDATDPEAARQALVSLLDETFQGYGLGFREVNGQMNVDFSSGVDFARLQQLTNLTREQLQEIANNDGTGLFGFLRPDVMQVLTFGNIDTVYDQLNALSGSTPSQVFEESTGITADVLAWWDGEITMGFLNYPVFGSTPDGIPSYFLMILDAASEQSAIQAEQELITSAQTGQSTRTSQAPRSVGFEVGTASSAPAAQGGTSTSTINNITVTTVTTPSGNIVQVARIADIVIMNTGENMATMFQNSGYTGGPTFTVDWRALAGVDESRRAAPFSSSPFVTALEFAGMAPFGLRGEVEAAGIVFPATNLNDPSLITIICSVESRPGNATR